LHFTVQRCHTSAKLVHTAARYTIHLLVSKERSREKNWSWPIHIDAQGPKSTYTTRVIIIIGCYRSFSKMKAALSGFGKPTVNESNFLFVETNNFKLAASTVNNGNWRGSLHEFSGVLSRICMVKFVASSY
jgi:hypothetical protein